MQQQIKLVSQRPTFSCIESCQKLLFFLINLQSNLTSALYKIVSYRQPLTIFTKISVKNYTVADRAKGDQGSQ